MLFTKVCERAYEGRLNPPFLVHSPDNLEDSSVVQDDVGADSLHDCPVVTREEEDVVLCLGQSPDDTDVVPAVCLHLGWQYSLVVLCGHS